MHEISLLENVREILEDYACREKFQRIKQVTLEIGALSCVEDKALAFGFDVVMKDSVASGAELVITHIDAQGVCDQCGKTMILQTLYEACVYCGHPCLNVIQGQDMRVKDLLVL